MQQLTGLDTSFLNIETPTSFGHICGLALFDPSTTEKNITLESLTKLISERLHLLPPFRRRLVEVPLGLDHPYWIEDPDFDLDFHVRHIGLPPPGNERQLAELVARIASRPLDRTRPLWELYFIEGLESGFTAQLTKIHHCAIDGVSGAEILMTLLDLTPENRVIVPPAKPWKPEPQPTDLEMLMRGWMGIAGTPRKGYRLMRDGLRHLPALANSFGLAEFPGKASLDSLIGRKPDPLLSEESVSVPHTIFNSRLTAHRRYAFGSLSLDRVKAIKSALGVTLNDVVLAICAGALRKYLDGRGELPSKPLVAMIPVSVRTEEQKGTLGNQVSAMAASLHTNVRGPVDRLKRIHTTMNIAKVQHKALPASLMQDFQDFAPPAIAARAARLIARAATDKWMEVPFNLIISNVPGPQFPIYGDGAKLIANYPVPPINDGVGLNITVQSYNGSLDFGIITCRELMPDAWELLDDLHWALEELEIATKEATNGAS